MPASLLESQLDTLEEPGSDENPMIVQMDGSPQENLEAAILAVTVAQRAGEGFCGPGEIHSSWELPG
jgi:gluconate kinase